MSRVMLIILLFSSTAIAKVETGIATIYSIHPSHGTLAQGTCFISGENDTFYTLTTAGHIIPDNNPVIVQYFIVFHEPSWESYVARPLKIDRINDVATLLMKRTDKISRHVIPVNLTYKLEPLERLVSYGISPKGALNISLFKFISNDDFSKIRLRGLSMNGHSGSPILNKNNECIAVLSEIAAAGIAVANRPIEVPRKISLLK